jgi:nicotinamidase-related amidase
MQALLVVDAQNEFSPRGLRPVPNHASALRAILAHVARARAGNRPIAWVQHHNKPAESRAFVPGTWGAALSDGLGPESGHGPERLFQKDVYGAFTTTPLDAWLREHGVTEVLITGFYAHMCVSTSVREALVRGFDVVIDPAATGARDLDDPKLGAQSADEVRRTAFLQLVNMGATLFAPEDASGAKQMVSRSTEPAAR